MATAPIRGSNSIHEVEAAVRYGEVTPITAPTPERVNPPRVAYMPDSFHEVNGVAHTSRNFQSYAERHNLPFLCIRAGNRKIAWQQQEHLHVLECRRSSFSLKLEKDLYFDLLYLRYATEISQQLRAFKPDILHITGPSELGILGAWLAWKMKIPLAASWHTNVHEYAARRSSVMLKWMPGQWSSVSEQWIEDSSLKLTARFYKLARVLFAPNAELCELLSDATGKPCRLMQRGVDTVAFSPANRTRDDRDGKFVLGYVGRLSVEKNITLLVDIERRLTALGHNHVKFLIVGHGGDESWLRQHLNHAEFTGVLRGEALQRAYADMDAFVFPSHTDTFGNVVLEALASGVPAVVTQHGGPKYIVRDGETGFIAEDENFAAAVESMIANPERHAAMRIAARRYAQECSWDAVFDRVYDAYEGIAQKRD
jgi:phosphatidylinositol alpha 1,6-mannosyltransferase